MTATNALTSINGTNGYQQHIQIDPAEPLALTVTNASGKVRVSSSDQSGVWVVVRRTDGEASDDPDDIPITVTVEGNSISIHPDWARAGGLGGIAKKIKEQLQNGFNASDWNFSNLKLNPDLSYDIRVEIPRTVAEGSKIVARTASGSTSVADIAANVTVATASGGAELRNVTGSTSVHSASGGITVEQANGSLEANAVSGGISVTGGEAWTALRTVSGRIQVDDFTMKNARIASVSGSVRANFVADNSQDYSIETVSGSVRFEVALPADVRSTLTFRSLSGSASTSGEWTPRGKKSWSAGDGEPGPRFSVKTVSGSLGSTVRTEARIVARHEALPASIPPAEVDDSPTASVDIDVDSIQLDVESRIETQSIERQIESSVEGAMDWVRDFTKTFTAPRETPPSPSPTAESQSDTTQAQSGSSASGAPASGGQSTEPIRQTAEPEDKASDDSSRLTVLEALERGEIDVDEALAQLDREERGAQ